MSDIFIRRRAFLISTIIIITSHVWFSSAVSPNISLFRAQLPPIRDMCVWDVAIDTLPLCILFHKNLVVVQGVNILFPAWTS